MARLVSKPVTFGIKAVLANQIPTGVTAAPDDPKLVDAWLSEIAKLAQHLEIVDHTA
jgi:saccharopine dehydrogenase (NADP+, L-glutamate forming)